MPANILKERLTDISPLLKVSARLLDLHDSRRSLGESTQYQTEERPGLGDGRYFCIAERVLLALQVSGKRSGDEYASVASIAQSVRGSINWANELDVEYVLNVLSRPTELRLLQFEGEDSHVIGDKETNLVDKAAHLSEYRLSRLGRKALAMAADNSDITYIEGDVTKLVRALETGRLKQALGFLDRLTDQLRTEQHALISVIERTSGGRKVSASFFTDLGDYEATMNRTSELVSKAQLQVDFIAKGAAPVLDEDIPIGLVRERVRELQRGIVGYARNLALLATQSLATKSSSVEAPSFSRMALRVASNSTEHTKLDFLLKTMGPVEMEGAIPNGIDFRGALKPRTSKESEAVHVSLDDYAVPPQDLLVEWLATHQDALNERMKQGGMTLLEAISDGLANGGHPQDIGCLVAALTSPDEWLTAGTAVGTFDPTLVISKLPGQTFMSSGIHIRLAVEKDRDMEPYDPL
jgi:hypothetical protein